MRFPTLETPALLFDIKTDGLLDNLTTIHCICAKDFLTGKVFSFGPQEIGAGLELLASAPLLVAHNGLCFDAPAIRQLHHSIPTLPSMFDTLTASRLIWTNLKEMDFTLLRRKSSRFPPSLLGKHSLEAWGHRLGCHKGEYGKSEGNVWEKWTEEMQHYCEQDVEVLEKLYRHILAQQYSPEALALEHEFQKIIFQQEQSGVPFNEQEAMSLYAELAAKRDSTATSLAELFPPKCIEEVFVPKVNNKSRGYVKGVPFTKVHYEPFMAGDTDRLFPTGSNPWLRQVWEKIRLHMNLDNAPQFVPHMLRHTCATRLAQKDLSMVVIKEWMGHSDIQTTSRYTHFAPKDLLNAAQLLG